MSSVGSLVVVRCGGLFVVFVVMLPGRWCWSRGVESVGLRCTSGCWLVCGVGHGVGWSAVLVCGVGLGVGWSVVLVCGVDGLVDLALKIYEKNGRFWQKKALR